MVTKLNKVADKRRLTSEYRGRYVCLYLGSCSCGLQPRARRIYIRGLATLVSAHRAVRKGGTEFCFLFPRTKRGRTKKWCPNIFVLLQHYEADNQRAAYFAKPQFSSEILRDFCQPKYRDRRLRKRSTNDSLLTPKTIQLLIYSPRNFTIEVLPSRLKHVGALTLA